MSERYRSFRIKFFEITVYPDPIAEIELDAFSDTLNCAPFTINSQVIEAVEYPENNTTYQWTFYNAFDNSVVQNGSGPQPPSFTMDNPGDSIIVELIATNDFECAADTAYISFYTWKQPDVSFSVDDVCLGDTSFFIDETSPGDSPLQDWLWTINGSGLFLDETDLSSEDPIYKFENCTENLAYSATLEVTDTNNCSDIYTFNNIQVFCLPDVEITSDPVCQDDESSFDFMASVYPTNAPIGVKIYLFKNIEKINIAIAIAITVLRIKFLLSSTAVKISFACSVTII